jgi:hypothetical protein
MYLETSMSKMIDEISDKFEKARGKKAKVYATPRTPGKTLRKDEGDMIDLDAYRSIAGRSCIMPPEICNAVQELATFIKPW